MYVKKVTKLQPGIYAHVCPLCNTVLSSACEPMYLPDFSICDCDKNDNKQSVYEIFELEGKQMIRRNKFPRFTGEITFGQLSDIENIEWLDECSLNEIVSTLRKAGEFLIKSNKNDKISG